MEFFLEYSCTSQDGESVAQTQVAPACFQQKKREWA